VINSVIWPVRARRPVPHVKEVPQTRRDTDALREAVIELGPRSARDSVARAEHLIAHRYEFLGHAEDLREIDWRRRYVNRLWTYNLHYFDYALDLAWAFHLTSDKKYAVAFETVVTSWIRGADDGFGDGWDPYPISIRTVNWLYAVELLDSAISTETRDSILASVFRQLSGLERRIEWHLLGNHVLANLKALAVGALVFDAERARSWRTKAVGQYWDQMKVQVCDDGGHFEGTPLYHAIVLSDLLEVIHLCRACGESVPTEITGRASSMVRALSLLTRQNGTLHLLNDSAQNVGPTPQHVARMAERVLGSPANAIESAWSLPQTGYHGYRNATVGSDLIVSCREPSPKFQPGHSHCDALSYECDVAGEQVIVDSGVHGYDGDFLREYVRSTRAHNTVVIGGRDQSEPWATFRFARRATEVQGWSELRDGVFVFEGSYRPYHDSHCRHRRKISFDGRGLIVTDIIEGQLGTSLESFLHFHPAFRVSLAGGYGRAQNGSLRLSIEPFGIDHLSVKRSQRNPEQGWYCPELGKAEPQDVLVLRVDRNQGAEFGYRIRPEERGF
jgi:hypothetical protein